MKWLEIIELRSVVSNRPLIEEKLKSLLKGKQLPIKVYNHISVNSDFSIHLLHDSKRPDDFGSPVGLRLISILKEFGLTHHSIWIEKITR